MTGHQLEIVTRMGIPVFPQPRPADLITDAIIGYSPRRDPRGRAASMITWASGQDKPVLALDLPSGLDPDTGRAGQPSAHAAATLTLALPKTGLTSPLAGDLFLADISVPPALYRQFGPRVPDLFRHDTIIRLRASPRGGPDKER